jgi:hypothetical protein
MRTYSRDILPVRVNTEGIMTNAFLPEGVDKAPLTDLVSIPQAAIISQPSDGVDALYRGCECVTDSADRSVIHVIGKVQGTCRLL